MSEWYCKIKHYFINLKLFHKLLCRHRGYDYSGLLIAMHTCIKDMESRQSSERVCVGVNRDKYCKSMRIVVNSLERLIEDEYATTKYFDYSFDRSKVRVTKLHDLPSEKIKWKVEKSQKQLDQDIVARAISKYIFYWWN